MNHSGAIGKIRIVWDFRARMSGRDVKCRRFLAFAFHHVFATAGDIDVKWAALVLAALLSLANQAASADPVPAQLIGTWRLVSNTLEEIPSGTRTDLFGPNPIGYIMYGADGRMMILQVR